ncbi:MAG: sodium:proline symporter [Gemmatimonadales bacterium]|nr:MAG: sodium:proline symporter [Gemmatimonadales bacterium]
MSFSPVTLVLGLYCLILLGIGLLGRRSTGSVAGYYVADKRLPSWVIAFSNNATGESAWLLLGLTGMGYAVGIHALWVVLGEVLGVTLGWTLVASRFKEYTDRYGAITVPDYLEARFRDTKHVFQLMGLVIIVSMVAAYTAAQFTAMGKAFGSFAGTSYGAGVLIGAAIILFYTTVGGFQAVAYSDVLQGVLMFLALLVLPIVGFSAAGGWSATFETLQRVDPALLRPMGTAGLSLSGVLGALGFVAVGFAFLGAPQLLVRWISARDRGEIVQGSLIAVICIIVFDLGAVFAGIAGRALFPGLPDQETILPTMAAELFPSVFTGIFLVVVLAASMSTVDSLLILASSSVARDVVQKIWRPDISDKTVALIGKGVTAVIGAVAVWFALEEVRLIFWFVLFAWSGLASAFTPVVLCSLFWKRTTRAGAIAGMAAGFLTAVIWTVAFKERFFDLYEMIPGFAAGFGATVLVSLLTRPPEGAGAELESVARAVEES